MSIRFNKGLLFKSLQVELHWRFIKRKIWCPKRWTSLDMDVRLFEGSFNPLTGLTAHFSVFEWFRYNLMDFCFIVLLGLFQFFGLRFWEINQNCVSGFGRVNQSLRHTWKPSNTYIKLSLIIYLSNGPKRAGNLTVYSDRTTQSY